LARRRHSGAGDDEIQFGFKLDYRSNVERYPLYQAYLREHQPRLLAVWGRNDAFFVPAGAEAFRRDLPHAEVQLLNTGHFALETHVDAIAESILAFDLGF
jgi:pimeloyl-ACP methyl ester carboxylesterase